MYKKISLRELSGHDNRLQLNSFRIKSALSTLRVHFYVMSFTNNDLSIISKRLRGEKPNYKSVAKEISKPPFFGS